MSKLGVVVEGPGDRDAVALLARNYYIASGRYSIEVSRPISTNGKAKLLKPGELERFVRLAGAEPGVRAIVVVFDADSGLACEDGPKALARAEDATHLPVKICIAVKKFENWIVASNATVFDKGEVIDAPETVGAMGVIKSALHPRKYVKTVDQARLVARVDTAAARQRAPSLDRFFRCLDELAVGASAQEDASASGR